MALFLFLIHQIHGIINPPILEKRPFLVAFSALYPFVLLYFFCFLHTHLHTQVHTHLNFLGKIGDSGRIPILPFEYALSPV